MATVDFPPGCSNSTTTGSPAGGAPGFGQTPPVLKALQLFSRITTSAASKALRNGQGTSDSTLLIWCVFSYV